MTKGGESETPYERIIGALNEWLDAFDAESAAQVRAELQEISATDTPGAILARIEHALRFLDEDATRMHERGEHERREADAQEQRAIEAIKAGDDRTAQEALTRQNEHLATATKHLDDALQLKWLLNQYRTAADGMRTPPDEEE